MKKRIFAGIAAAIMTATMCFAFTACEDSNKNVELDNTVSDNTGNEVGADYNAFTEEQWIQAFEDTAVEATNYKLAVKRTETANYNNAVEEDVLELNYDGADLKGYATFERGIEYVEVLDSAFIRYTYYEDDGWHADAEEFVTANEARERFEEYTNELGSILTSQFKGTGDKEEISGTLDELYGLFSYDSNTHAYSATLKNADPYSDFELTLQISFKDGKLYNVVTNYVQGDGYWAISYRNEMTITYGGVSITIPQEAKDALEDID